MDLARPSAVPGWRRAVDRALLAHLKHTVTELWSRGWQPVDVVRVANRKLSQDGLRLVRDAVADELRTYAPSTVDPAWAVQCQESGIRVWWREDQNHLQAWEHGGGDRQSLVSEAVEVLSLLNSLPDIELVGPRPGSPQAVRAARRSASQVDQRILSRVRVLLAKAESTAFEAEADTFTAGAQALMARHSIDAALLAASEPGSADGPIARRLGIDNPYEASKAMLLQAVAEANRCRMVWSKSFGYGTVVGHAGDVAAVDTLFTSLLVQATRAMTQAGSRTTVYGSSRTRSFRQSFLGAFATRIGERLSEASAAETATVVAERGTDLLLPVLASRDSAVAEAVAALFPEMKHTGVNLGRDREGWQRGRVAADLAVVARGAPLTG